MGNELMKVTNPRSDRTIGRPLGLPAPATRMEVTDMPRRCQNLSFGTSLGTGETDGKGAFQMNEDRFRHTVILGRTGSGKSNLVQQMEREDIRNGAGAFILAAHEEDALYPIACVPEERLGDVVLLDFSNPEWLPRMNPLDVDLMDRRAVDRAVEDVIELLCTDNRYDWAGPRFEKMARDGLRLLMGSPRGEDRVIANLARVYVEPDYVKELLGYCTDRHVYDQWTKVFPEETKSNESGDIVHWFISKVTRFASDRTLGHVFGPGRSTVDVADAMDEGKVLVAYVPEDRLGPKAARTISRWLVLQLRRAIMGRRARAGGWPGLGYGLYEDGPETAAGEADPFFVYIDEFAKFASADFEALLAESRKQGVGFVLSFQTLSQTRTLDYRTGKVGGLEEAILGNVGSMVCYPMGVRDAELLAGQLDVGPDVLRRIGRYRPLARLCRSNAPGPVAPLEVGLRPEPDNPTAPRRVARSMALSGTWLEVEGAAGPGRFMRMVDPHRDTDLG